MLILSRPTTRLLIILAVLAFGGSATLAQMPHGYFLARLVSEPQTLDWTLCTAQSDSWIISAMMEGLMEFDGQMRIKPALAESYKISSDGKTFTFHLRRDVHWSDGRALVANDFLYSWQRLLSPLTAAPYSYLLYDIDGAEDFHKGKNSDFSRVGIKVIDATTIQIHTRETVPYFLQLLTLWSTFPLRKDLIDRFGSAWTKPENLVVIGPFTQEQTKEDSTDSKKQINLKRNPQYYGNKPSIAGISFTLVSDDSKALSMFRDHSLDWVMPIRKADIGSLFGTSSYKSVPYYNTGYLGFNVNKYPMSILKFRQAVALAIDKSGISKALHHDKPPTDTLVAKELLPEAANTGMHFNPTTARKLLAETGIDPETSPPIQLLAPSSDDGALLGEYVQQQLEKNLELKVEVKLLERQEYQTQLDLNVGDLFYGNWDADYNDADSYFDIFRSDSGNNKTGWRNEEYDALVDQAGSTLSKPERVRLYLKALDLLLNKQTVIAPLHFDRTEYLISARVKNFMINPLNSIRFRDIVLSQ